jgi:HSP20 family protein
MDPLAHWNQTRLNQLNEMDDLQHTLRNIVRRSRAHRPKDQVRVPQWIPLVTVSEDARGYVIKAELPQVKKEDIRITLEEGTLIITGERKFDENSKKDQPPALICGRFAHSFVIPNDARPTKLTAVFQNEVLTVHLTKNAKAGPEQLKSKVSKGGAIGLSIEESQ